MVVWDVLTIMHPSPGLRYREKLVTEGVLIVFVVIVSVRLSPRIWQKTICLIWTAFLLWDATHLEYTCTHTHTHTLTQWHTPAHTQWHTPAHTHTLPVATHRGHWCDYGYNLYKVWHLTVGRTTHFFGFFTGKQNMSENVILVKTVTLQIFKQISQIVFEIFNI